MRVPDTMTFEERGRRIAELEAEVERLRGLLKELIFKPPGAPKGRDLEKRLRAALERHQRRGRR